MESSRSLQSTSGGEKSQIKSKAEKSEITPHPNLWEQEVGKGGGNKPQDFNSVQDRKSVKTQLQNQ